ncbi:MAG TPA: hypothetical protein VLA39_00025, partial [Marinobacterium sp.]|nr:hypothetical protein [Marinobacterium sp.]
MSKKRSLQPANEPKLMQLEQRLMFDGAVAETTADVLGSDSSYEAESLHDTGIFQLAVAYEPAKPAAESATAKVRAFVEIASSETLHHIFASQDAEITADSLMMVEAARSAILAEQLDIQLEVIESTTNGDALTKVLDSETADGLVQIFDRALQPEMEDQLVMALIEDFGQIISSKLALDPSANQGGERFVTALYDALEREISVITDLQDYAPGSTAFISVSGIDAGASVELEIDHVNDPGADGLWGTTDDQTYQLGGEGHDAWVVTDGGEADLDGQVDGQITAQWYVNPDDSLDERFILSAEVVESGADGTFGTADDVRTGEIALHSFTDSIDTDGDGIVDSLDIDDDNDGIADIDEQTVKFDSLYETIAYSYAQTFDGNTAFHYVVPGSTGGDDPVNLYDNDMSTDLRLHDGDIMEFDLGTVLPAGTVLVLYDGTGGNDTPVMIMRSLESTDTQGDSLAILDSGLGKGFEGAVGDGTLGAPNGLSTVVEAYLWDETTGDFALDAQGERILYTYKDGSGGSFGGSTFPDQVADNLSKDGYTPSDASVVFVLEQDTRYLQFVGTSDGEKHGGWGELQLASLTQVISMLDTDNDGLADHLDIDKDNDGILDNIEAQTTADYKAPSGLDVNRDGLDDAYGSGLKEVDTDADGVRDSRDSDSDNDGLADVAERLDGAPDSITLTADEDQDGLLDIFEGVNVADGFDVNERNIEGDNGGLDGNYSRFNLADSDADTNANEEVLGRTSNDAVAIRTDLDYRDAENDIDTDLDGIRDPVDLDDDNDGILDSVEKTLVYAQPLSETASVSYMQLLSFNPSASNGTTTVATAANLIDGDESTELALPDNTIVEYDLGQVLYAGTSIQFVEGAGSADNYVQIFSSYNSTDHNNPAIGGWSGYSNTGGLYYALYAGFSDRTITLTLTEDTRFIQIVGRGGASGFSELRLTSQAQVMPKGIDSDGDGLADHLDIDKDNDGITDNIEAQSTAGYKAPSGVGQAMTDNNANGVDDLYEGGLTEVDTDGDGVVDSLDSDSDNDGGGDIAERGFGPTSLTDLTDTDTDGLLDIFEGADAHDGFDTNDELISGDNADNGSYGYFKLADTDADNDATNDVANRTSNSAVPLTFDLDFRDAQTDVDTDGDGVVDARDIDDDNDGILDSVERNYTYIALSTTSTFSFAQNADGSVGGNAAKLISRQDEPTHSESPALLVDGNTGTQVKIGSNVIIEYDLGQTIYPGTLIELFEGAGGNDGNAKVFVSSTSMNQANAWNHTQSNATQVFGGENGQASNVTFTFSVTEPIQYIQILSIGGTAGWEELRLSSLTQEVDIDTDGDGLSDHLDIDKDNDGITDNIEAQTTLGYIAPSMEDIDRDGLDDRYDDNLSGANNSVGLLEIDTDADGAVDTKDLNSDNDRKTDQQESGLAFATSSQDSDNDGLLDAYERGTVNDGFVVNDGVTPLDGSLPDLDADAASGSPDDLDYREVNIDTDGDGIFDIDDIDD